MGACGRCPTQHIMLAFVLTLALAVECFAQTSAVADAPMTDMKAPEAELELATERKCMPFCNASCCYFSNPAKECGGCDPQSSIMCAPGAECFEQGSATKTIGQPVVTEKGTCSPWCLDTPHCCWFSKPKEDCGGCGKDHGCHSEAPCFKTGRRDEL